MIHDAACPPSILPPASAAEREGVLYTAARWTPETIAELVAHLDGRGRHCLAALSADRVLSAWRETIAALRDPGSAESETLRPALARLCRLSRPGLDAALEAILGGVERAAANRLAEAVTAPAKRGLVSVFLAGNLPALAVQPLLPALLLRRPVLLKSPTAEPLFAPALVRSLARREPSLTHALAAVTWPGGDLAIEAPLIERSETLVVYGEEESIASLARRAPDRCVAYGPKTSLAVVAGEAVQEQTIAGLVRDIALLDQRGCLSIQAIYTDGDARELAGLLATALSACARRWPAGPLDPIAAAGVQQVRTDARMRGLFAPSLPFSEGTVVVEPLPAFQPSPGLRTVRVHPLASLAQLPTALAKWQDRLQGAALAGTAAWRLEADLTRLGVSRCTIPGNLQSPDALWHNGGIHPLAALGAD